MDWITLIMNTTRVLAIAVALVAATYTTLALRKFTRRITLREKDILDTRVAKAEEAAASAIEASDSAPDCIEAAKAARIAKIAANNATRANAAITAGEPFSYAERAFGIINDSVRLAIRAAKVAEKASLGDIDTYNWFITLLHKQDVLKEEIRSELLHEVQEEIVAGVEDIIDISGDEERILSQIDEILSKKVAPAGSKEIREVETQLLRIAKASDDYMTRLQALTRVMSARYDVVRNATIEEYDKLREKNPYSLELKKLSLKTVIYKVLGATMDYMHNDWTEEAGEKAMVFLETYARKSLSPDLFE